MAARETVQRFGDIGVDELLLIKQMGTVPHELVMESIRTFGAQVLPHRQAATRVARAAARLAEAIGASL